METIQVVLDSELLAAADCAAKLTKVNRSALIRDALRAHLRRLKVLELEQRDRLAYQRFPADSDEAARWEAVAAWPGE